MERWIRCGQSSVTADPFGACVCCHILSKVFSSVSTSIGRSKSQVSFRSSSQSFPLFFSSFLLLAIEYQLHQVFNWKLISSYFISFEFRSNFGLFGRNLMMLERQKAIYFQPSEMECVCVLCCARNEEKRRLSCRKHSARGRFVLPAEVVPCWTTRRGSLKEQVFDPLSPSTPLTGIKKSLFCFLFLFLFYFYWIRSISYTRLLKLWHISGSIPLKSWLFCPVR